MDPSLNGGSAYFVEENAFKTYLLLHAADSQEVFFSIWISCKVSLTPDEEEYMLLTYCRESG